jgi:hypothetical protein
MIERAFRTIALAAVLLAPLGAHAAPAQMTRIPALFQNGEVYLKVSVNNAAPVWMMFDLAAPGSTLYAAHAARVTVRAGAIAGPVTFHPSTGSAPCAPDGSVVAGRLGSDWLGDRVAEIRPREREVWLSAPVDPSPAPAERAVADASLAR